MRYKLAYTTRIYYYTMRIHVHTLRIDALWTGYIHRVETTFDISEVLKCFLTVQATRSVKKFLYFRPFKLASIKNGFNRSWIISFCTLVAQLLWIFFSFLFFTFLHSSSREDCSIIDRRIRFTTNSNRTIKRILYKTDIECFSISIFSSISLKQESKKERYSV